ncbi:hypothetical protein RvY_11832-2 [Ramazzottius varieornatus]|nr:hypothetical protein RvY_11832-2 [Ramazzottius varieornatus]
MEVLRDGSALKQRIANCRFQLKSGWVEFNEFGERVIDPSLLFFNPETDDFEPATVFDAPGNFSIQLRRPWFNQNALPTNEPLCGYQAQKCDHQADSTVPNVAIASSIAAVLLVVSLFTYMGMQ